MNYPLALQKAVSASMVRHPVANLLDDLSTFDEKDAMYIAWRACKSHEENSKDNL